MIYLLMMLIFQTECYTLRLHEYPLLSDSAQSSFKGWLQFTINLIDLNGTQSIIVFGGTLNNISQNQAILSTMSIQNEIILNQNILAPEPRYLHCTLGDGKLMYVYGGVGQNGKIFQDLWEFNSSLLMWKFLSNSPSLINNCNLIKNNSFILLFGVDSSSNLVIWQYSLTTGNWLQISYSYGYAVINEGMIWQQMLKKTQTNIDNLSPYQSINTTNIVYSTQLTINNFCMSSADNLTYYIVTDTKILLINLSTNMINWIRNIQKLDEQFQCQITSQWLFIISRRDQFLTMSYYSLLDFYKTSTKTYINPYPQYKLISFMINENLYLLSQSELRGWILNKNCQTNLGLSNVQACFYGEVFCSYNYRGETCQQINCPNTLILTDLSIFSKILFQCNNHGVCIDAKCICTTYWSGEDCSTYTRTQCYGQLLDNWPVMNCECLSQITGGNDCEVTFCYNDCNGQGTCLSTGLCQCNKGYYGADCSITIIELDHPASGF